MSRRLKPIPITVPLESAEHLADPAEPVEDCVIRSLERQRVRRQVRALPRFEGKVIVLRYGLDGDRPATVRECASFLRCSPALVHKTEHRALSGLRAGFDPEAESAALRKVAAS